MAANASLLAGKILVRLMLFGPAKYNESHILPASVIVVSNPIRIIKVVDFVFI
jgi:hypothetical protein